MLLDIPIEHGAGAESSPPVIRVDQAGSIPQPVNPGDLGNHSFNSILSQSKLQLLVITRIVPQALWYHIYYNLSTSRLKVNMGK